MTIRNILTAVLPAIFFTATALSAESSPQARYSEARAAFEKGDFGKAQYLCESLVNEQHLAPALFQLCTGIKYGMPSTPEMMAMAKSMLPQGSAWAGFGPGKHQLGSVIGQRIRRDQRR